MLPHGFVEHIVFGETTHKCFFLNTHLLDQAIRRTLVGYSKDVKIMVSHSGKSETRINIIVKVHAAPCLLSSSLISPYKYERSLLYDYI